MLCLPADFVIPPFVAHPLFRGGHAQTLAGAYLPGGHCAYAAQRHVVSLDDGDQIVLHDDRPSRWRSGDRATLLIHGLAGSHQSGYMRRVASKLGQRGVRAFRMDLRGCGAGEGLARLPYHSGRSEDAAAALEAVARIAPGSSVTLVGFSLGGNITLKLLAELGGRACGGLDSAMAVCAPMDLAACSRAISEPANRRYDRYFVRLLVRQLALRRKLLPHAPQANWKSVPRTIWEFDNQFTAPVCGFGTAENYYRQASSAPLLGGIALPTLIVAAQDDPMIPPAVWKNAAPPDCVTIHVSPSGGHLGFFGRGGTDADRRWIDWRVVDWVAAQGSVAPAAQPMQ